MSLPIFTRTVTIDAPADAGDDPTDTTDTWTNIASGARAHISAPSGRAAGEGREQVDAILYTDPGPALTRLCRITDDTTSEVYAVTWCTLVLGFGLDHWKAGLVRAKGASRDA